jgi:hypothetical protein
MKKNKAFIEGPILVFIFFITLFYVVYRQWWLEYELEVRRIEALEKLANIQRKNNEENQSSSGLIVTLRA